jgi:ribulose 1,5-bisphosphate synthetase/thiazole synthase
MNDVAVQASDAPTIATRLIAKNVDIVTVDTISPRKMRESMIYCAAETVDTAGLSMDSASLASETIIDATNRPANVVAAQISSVSRKHTSPAPPPT